MRTGVLALLLAAIFSLFFSGVQETLRTALHRRPRTVWLAPALLWAFFCVVAAAVGQFSFPLAALVAVYAAAPVAMAAYAGAGWIKTPAWPDFVVIGLLWLPIEFAAGAHFVSKHAQGFLHSVIYGVAILLALVLFVGFRSFSGLKLAWPARPRDLWLPLAGFALVAPVLIALGVWLGFIPPFHQNARFTAARYAGSFLVVLAGTGLPEEILFRSLVQNLLMLRYGQTERVLWAASAIFGAAHLNNGPQALPNWRYAILATLAGYAYGKVFQKAGSVLSPAGLHGLVDTTKHWFF